MAINWKNRAKKFEAEALASHEKLVRIAFGLEKEKALHRRTCEEANLLDQNLNHARMLLYGAAENLRGHGQTASASALHVSADGLYVIPRAATVAKATKFAPKDEQH